MKKYAFVKNGFNFCKINNFEEKIQADHTYAKMDNLSNLCNENNNLVIDILLKKFEKKINFI